MNAVATITTLDELRNTQKKVNCGKNRALCLCLDEFSYNWNFLSGLQINVLCGTYVAYQSKKYYFLN